MDILKVNSLLLVVVDVASLHLNLQSLAVKVVTEVFQGTTEHLLELRPLFAKSNESVPKDGQIRRIISLPQPAPNCEYHQKAITSWAGQAEFLLEQRPIK